MLHGPDYIAQSSIGIFEGKHHEVINLANIEYHASRERVLEWITKQIVIVTSEEHPLM